MKKINRVGYSLANAVTLILLICFTSCENTNYDLLDPDSAGVWTQYTANNSELPGNKVNDIVADNSGNMWIACAGKGLVKYVNGTWTKYNTLNSSILSDSVTAIESTTDGRIIVGTTNGIAILNASGQWSSYKDPLVSTMEINSVRMVSDGSLWVGTYDQGFYINASSVYTHSPSGFTVYTFEEDNAGNVWMGTSYGLLKWNGTAWTNITSTEGLPAGSVTSLCIDSKGRVWIGVLGANKVYWRNNSGIHALSLMTGSAGIEIKDICEDKNGDIWFATNGSGLIRYDGVVPHSYKSYNAFTSELFSEDNVNCITKDKEGNMWFGFTTKGLVKYTLPLN